jgi:hypothetical protein
MQQGFFAARGSMVWRENLGFCFASLVKLRGLPVISRHACVHLRQTAADLIYRKEDYAKT